MRSQSDLVARLPLLGFLTALVFAISGCHGSDHASTTSTPRPGASTYGVGLYDLSLKTFRSIPLPDPVSQARWVSDGETFAAFDTKSRVTEIFDLHGTKKATIASADAVHTSHHGAIIVEHSASKSLASFDIATMSESPFPVLPGENSDAVFSPDGTRVAYVNKDSSRKNLVLAGADGSSPQVVLSENDPNRVLGIGDAAWSPDGQWLLVSNNLCARGPDPQCHQDTGFAYKVIDLTGRVVWTKESSIIFIARWGGPDRVLTERPEVTPDAGQFGTQQAFIAIPDGTQTLAPDIVHPASELSPDGRLVLDKKSALYTCALTDIQTGDALVEGGCGLEDWTTDGKLDLIWDTGCSALTRLTPSERCIDGRFQPPLPEPTPTVDTSGRDAYTPGPSCTVPDVGADPVTPSASASSSDDQAPTPQYYAALKGFVTSRFKATYVGCVKTKTGTEQRTITWYKDGTQRSRFDVHEVVRGNHEFDLTYIEDGSRLIVCGKDLGRYLSISFPVTQDAPPLFQQFEQAVQPLTAYGDACVEDDHHVLFFDPPFDAIAGDNNPLTFPGGIADPRKIDTTELDAADVSKFGSYPTRGTRVIAGQIATCFANRYSESCFTADGVPLFAVGDGSVEAVSVSTDVQSADFDPTFPVKTEISQCFPKPAIPTESAGSVATEVSHGDFDAAVKSAALNLADLPCDWTTATAGSGTRPSCEFCCDGFPTYSSPGMSKINVEFKVTRDEGSTTYVEDELSQQVAYDRGGSFASDLMRNFELYWAACSDHTFTDGSGDQVTMHSRRLDGPAYGDQSDVYLLTFNHPAYGDYVLTYIRRGNSMTSLVYYDGALGIRDPNRTRAVAAANRIAAVADGKLAALTSSP